MTDAELRSYSQDHLYYELWMLFETASRVLNDRALHDDRLLKNAVIESFTVHARALTVFLWPDVVRSDDITSDHYVIDPAAWASARGPIPGVLKTVIRRTAKEIAHLTSARHRFYAPEKMWDAEPILAAFREPFRVFAAHATPGRLDASVSMFIATLGAAMIPRPVTIHGTTSTEMTTASGPPLSTETFRGSLPTDVRTRGLPGTRSVE